MSTSSDSTAEITAACSVPPTFGGEAKLGTEPISFGAPAEGDDYFLLDMATTTVAQGKVLNLFVDIDGVAVVAFGRLVGAQAQVDSDPLGAQPGQALAEIVARAEDAVGHELDEGVGAGLVAEAGLVKVDQAFAVFVFFLGHAVEHGRRGGKLGPEFFCIGSVNARIVLFR